MTDWSAYLSLLGPAWATAALLALWSAPLGCLVLWRRMAFFADTMAHGTLLGVGLAAWLAWPMGLGVALVAFTLVGLLWLWHDERLPTDSLMALLAAGLLCAGLVVIQFNPVLQPQLNNYLFGDLLALEWAQVPQVALGVSLGVGILVANWRRQVLVALNEDLAQLNGINVAWQRLLVLLMVAGFTVLAMRAAGSLLLGALLVVPALTARLVSRTPRQMVCWALLAAQFAIMLGLVLSVWVNIPTGPAIVLMMASGFTIVFALQRFLR